MISMMIKKFDFEKYFNCVIKIIPLNIVALTAMTIYRLFFFFYFQNIPSFKDLYSYIFQAFFLGMRFDLSVIAWVNVLVIFIFTIFLLIKNLKLFSVAVFFIKIYYWIAFTAIALLNTIDFSFYVCFDEHINILLFGFFSDDTFALVKTIMYDWRFPIALLILTCVSFAIYKIISLTLKSLANRYYLINASFCNAFIKTFIVLFIPFLIFCFARGTTSMFPLGKFHTQISPNQFINNISITSVHSLTDAISAKMEQKKNKIDIVEKLKINEYEIDLTLFNKLSMKNDAAKKIKPNVVFIVLEGFGELPLLYNNENFDVLGELKQHFDNDTVLYNFLAAGVITIHCLESTILNMPQRPFSIQITQTQKAFQHFSSSLVLPYKRSSYLTKAVYGGSLAWRGIEGFLKAQGFDEIYGEGSIKNEYRHEWGINDAQFFEIVLRELKNNNETPKFIYAMSTATHPPYKTPPYYKSLKLEIPKEVLQMMPNEKNTDRKFLKVINLQTEKLQNF
jgi:hypothetical protein